MAPWKCALFIVSLLAACISTMGPMAAQGARLSGDGGGSLRIVQVTEGLGRRLQQAYGYPTQQGQGGAYQQQQGGGYPQGGGYQPQQGGSYPQQGGYPQQQGSGGYTFPQQVGGGGSYPQQPGPGAGYPQQGGSGPVYPQQGGTGPVYPQQGAQYPQQGGQYPQQGGQYPQQGGGGYGYSQQGSGSYPQQGGSGGGSYPQQGGGYPTQQSGGYYPQQGGGYYPQQGGGTGGYTQQGGYGGGSFPQQGGYGGGYPQQGGYGGWQPPTWNGGVQPSAYVQQAYPGDQGMTAPASTSTPANPDVNGSIESPPSTFISPRPMGDYTYPDVPTENATSVPDDANVDALLRIDCGNEANDTVDDWDADVGYFTDGGSETHRISNDSLPKWVQTFRKFPAGFGCYRIARPDGRYIVRMTFAHQGYDGTPLAQRPKFMVLVEATEVEEVDLTDPEDDPHVTETILDVTDGLVQVCVNNISNAPPIINSLEIIPIESDSYDDLDYGPNSILLTQIRFSAGGPEIIEDVDPMKRDWQGDTSFLAGTSFNLTGARIENSETPPGYFPNKLFETAWNPQRPVIEIPIDGLPQEESEYYIRFFLAELSGDDMQVGSRVFDISVNGKVIIPGVDIFASAGQRRYWAVMKSQRFNSSGETMKISLTKTEDSTLNPILCGFELLQVVPIFRAVSNPYIGGAIRIDCGSQKEYTDAYDRFWDSDYGFTSGRMYNVTNVDVLEKNNLTKAMSTLRAFPYGLQNCYEIDLPVSRYLVRINAASLDYESPPPTMGIIIEGAPTRLSRLQEFSSQPIDFIVHVGDNELDVCFYRNISEPVINGLQMIEMDSSAYGGADRKRVVLNRFYWINCGGPRLGFPEQDVSMRDKYERQWLTDVQTPSIFDPVTASSYAAPNAQQQIRNADTKPFDYPSGLYRTVRYSDSGSLTYTLYVWNAWDYSVYLHFVELNTSLQQGDRVFDVIIQGVTVVKGLDIMYMSGGHNVAYVVNQTGVSTLPPDANGGHAISIVLKSTAESRMKVPTIAGIEVYSEIEIPSPTRASDLDAMNELRRQLQIPEPFGWNGDPCVPMPFWTGVDCNVYDDGREATVKSIVLEGYGLLGTLPAELGNLTDLRVLDVSHNLIAGAIPPELGKCSNLTTLDLSYNKFTGPIPQELSSIPRLANVSVNDNLLNGPVPTELARKNVKILLANNPGLCGYDGLPKCSAVLNGTAGHPKHKLNRSQVAGVVCGCIAFVLLVGVAGGAFLYKRRNERTGYTLAQTLSARKYPYERAYSGNNGNGANNNNTLEMGRRVQLADDY